MCTEKTIVLPLGRGWQVDGMHRITEAELRVKQRDISDGSGPPGPHVFRQLLKINGTRAARQGQEGSIGLFRPESADAGTDGVSAAVAPRRLHLHRQRVRQGTRMPARCSSSTCGAHRSKPELIEDPQGREDCFELSAPLSVKGRVVIDKDTYDVLRVEEHLAGPRGADGRHERSSEHNFSPLDHRRPDRRDDPLQGRFVQGPGRNIPAARINRYAGRCIARSCSRTAPGRNSRTTAAS